jgi:hypothetical protein
MLRCELGSSNSGEVTAADACEYDDENLASEEKGDFVII